MNIVDIILVVIALGFVATGWQSGFVRSFGGLIAFILSFVGTFYVMNWVHDTYGISLATNLWITVIGSLIVLIIMSRLAKYLVEALDLIRKAVAIIPFVNTVNSLLGAIFGLLQFGVLLFASTYIFVLLVPGGEVRMQVLSSQAVSWVIDIESDLKLL